MKICRCILKVEIPFNLQTERESGKVMGSGFHKQENAT